MRRALGVLLLLGLLLAPAAVSAHAYLDRSSPADGERLLRSPKQLKLWFTEPLVPSVSAVSLLNAAGQPVQGVAVTGADSVLTVALPDLPGGAYTLQYKVLSVDTHVVAGSLTFTVDKPPAESPPTPATTPAEPAKPASPAAAPAPATAEPPATADRPSAEPAKVAPAEVQPTAKAVEPANPAEPAPEPARVPPTALPKPAPSRSGALWAVAGALTLLGIGYFLRKRPAKKAPG